MPANFCSTPPSDPSEISFCDHKSALGNVINGVQTGLITSELNPPLPAALQPAQTDAKNAYRNYLRTGDRENCILAYSPNCPPA